MSGRIKMTPSQINAKHGKPMWRCNTCGSIERLEWWNGLSVAVCVDDSTCGKAQGEKFATESAEHDAWAKYEAEWAGNY